MMHDQKSETLYVELTWPLSEAEQQLIAEAAQLLKPVARLGNKTIVDYFEKLSGRSFPPGTKVRLTMEHLPPEP